MQFAICEALIRTLECVPTIPLSPSTVKWIVEVTFGNKLAVNAGLISFVPTAVQHPFRETARGVFDGPNWERLLPALECRFALNVRPCFSRCRCPLIWAELALELFVVDGCESPELLGWDNSIFKIKRKASVAKLESWMCPVYNQIGCCLQMCELHVASYIILNATLQYWLQSCSSNYKHLTQQLESTCKVNSSVRKIYILRPNWDQLRKMKLQGLCKNRRWW